MSQVVALAARTVSQRLLGLLPTHKAALFAAERAAAVETAEAVRLVASNPVEAFRASRRSLRAAHLVAVRMGMRHAALEFALLGLEVPSRVRRPLFAYLNRAASDLRLSLRDRRLDTDTKALRAGLAATVVVNRAYSDGQLAMYRAVLAANPAVSFQKVWVTNKAAGQPCKFCLRLDGQAVPVEEEFTAPSGLKVYNDLQGPPCHPNCRCRVVVRVVP